MSEIERHSKEIYEKEKENDLVVFFVRMRVILFDSRIS